MTKTDVYNQLAQEQTHYSCSIYAFLNILKYDYGIELEVDWILKIVIYMEKIGALLSEGAYASVIYPALIKYVKWKTGFKLKMITKPLTQIDSKKGWILGFKKSNRDYIKLSEDKRLTEEDIDDLIVSKGGAGHFHMFKRNVILETLGGYPYKCTKQVLLYAYNNQLYYKNARAFIPADDKTEEAQKELIALVKKRSKGTDYKFISYEELMEMYKKD